MPREPTQAETEREEARERALERLYWKYEVPFTILLILTVVSSLTAISAGQHHDFYPLAIFTMVAVCLDYSWMISRIKQKQVLKAAGLED